MHPTHPYLPILQHLLFDPEHNMHTPLHLSNTMPITESPLKQLCWVLNHTPTPHTPTPNTMLGFTVTKPLQHLTCHHEAVDRYSTAC